LRYKSVVTENNVLLRFFVGVTTTYMEHAYAIHRRPAAALNPRHLGTGCHQSQEIIDCPSPPKQIDNQLMTMMITDGWN